MPSGTHDGVTMTPRIVDGAAAQSGDAIVPGVSSSNFGGARAISVVEAQISSRLSMAGSNMSQTACREEGDRHAQQGPESRRPDDVGQVSRKRGREGDEKLEDAAGDDSRAGADSRETGGHAKGEADIVQERGEGKGWEGESDDRMNVEEDADDELGQEVEKASAADVALGQAGCSAVARGPSYGALQRGTRETSACSKCVKRKGMLACRVDGMPYPAGMVIALSSRLVLTFRCACSHVRQRHSQRRGPQQPPCTSL